jgi:tubulin-specific chaperone B
MGHNFDFLEIGIGLIFSIVNFRVGFNMTTIRLDFTHVGLGLELTEIMFNTSQTLLEMKKKLYPKTGTEPNNMQLSVLDIATGVKRILEGDESTLEQLGLENANRLELVDTNDSSITNNKYETGDAKTDNVKYEAKRGDSGFAKFRKERETKTAAIDTGMKIDDFHLNQRVFTQNGYNGTIRYLGAVSGLSSGDFVGIELDTPNGKNDGTIKGIELFTCEENHGSLVRPNTVRPLELDNDNGIKSESKNDNEYKDEI